MAIALAALLPALRYLVPNSQIVYIALSDAAFYRGDTDYLMRTPGSQGII